ncbi:cofactor-independent phosphoglycerate mutase [Rubinisphaera sp.]|uniref:cofactor-independent phosphoglycerate mutase n=1 Tax=Rubinisphaera sp. TaxID=2024857 RepID=UPI000C0F5934|nr:cofactor-independent phosphoglycerate mutase [Rubinisphaera sp.]MBV11622.1 cofactor-independent phosphoglycerate mutase [Rubinisphaera sp.]HCS51397.1 cofactor-independent phosphoglycerate mutase [Planctomycetaceae bacterium]|tara:strand:+ start:5623 stop:6828 length:1206 start_codon:yes stop_codon:yes gene_type:complete
MKYALVIPDGAADEPQDQLDGRTPLQAAVTPHMDQVAREGILGRTDNIPPSMPSGSDVGTMSLFGYDPLKYHTGRAPLEAAAQGIELGPHDWAIRCNLVTIINEIMVSFTAGQFPSDLGRELIHKMQELVSADPRWEFVAGVSYRNLLLFRNPETTAPFDETTLTFPPHDLTDQSVTDHRPTGAGSELLNSLMGMSKDCFRNIERNVAREHAGTHPATEIWLWGQGSRPALTPFQERYGVSGAVITAVDLLRGIGRLIGWDIVEVEGATGYLDTDYAAKGRAAIETLQSDTDFVVVHVEATDEASHEGDCDAKLEALQRIDSDIVAPLHDYLKSQGEYRLLISPDHPTFLRTKTHSHGYVPFAIAGTGITPDENDTYDEIRAEYGETFKEGHLLMNRFLKG